MTVAEPGRARLNTELERVASGDRAALHAVYELTAAKLYGVCLHILADHALAEDVLQEVYLKVWQSAGAFDSARASPITWLCMIARNRAIDWRRAAGRYDAALDAAAIGPPVVAPPEAADERSHALHRCLDTLEDHASTSIRAAFLDGFTYSELAARTSVPLATMKSWIRRGLAQLKRCIEDA